MPAGSSASYDYDVIGDLTHKQEGSTDLTLCYPASGQPRPHAVTTEYATPATCGTGTPLSAFGYQGDGAMIASGDQGSGQRGGHAFDAENRLTEVLSAPANTSGGGFSCVDIDGDAAITNADANIIMADNGLRTGDPGYNYLADINQDGVITAGMSPGTDYFLELVARGSACGNTQDKYTYDGNGKLIKREHLVQSASGWTAQSWTVYIGGVYEMHSDGSVTKYYAGQGRTVAIRTVPSNGGAGALSFPVTDHLGSTRALLDTNGAVAGTASYWPYGALRNFTVGLIVTTDKLYTGQQMQSGDQALGLYNYHARFYSTTLGAFVSADTVGDGLNRYEYVHDNPLRYIDPTGHCSSQPCPVSAPSPEGTPTPASAVAACAADLKACLEWSFGIADRGVVIVMGLTQSVGRSIGDFEGYAETFLDRYDSAGCGGGRASACFSAMKQLAETQGSDAAYDVFGIKFIESDWHGLLAPGIAGALFGITDIGVGALKSILNNPRGKSLVGVIGHSLGADTVATVFAEDPNKYRKIPFFLDSAYETARVDRAQTLPNAAHVPGGSDFFGCGRECTFAGVPDFHGPRDDLANAVFDQFDALSVSLGGGS